MSEKRANAADTYKIGVLIPMSGPAGLFGPSARNCTDMAVAEINAAGGILGRKVEVVYGDVGVPPAEATQAAVKLMLGEKVDAFVGMHDSAVREALIGAFRGKVPYVYTPTYEGGECAPGVFVLGETPDQQLAPVIPWMAKERGVKSWYLIGNDYNWPRDSNAAAKRYIADVGGRVVGEEYLPFTIDNFDANLVKIKESKADGVLVTLVGGASVGFNRSFASFGLADEMVRLGTLIEENTLLGIGAENSKNLYSSAGYFGNLETTAAKTFAERYAAKFGADAPVLNALGQSCYEGMLFLSALANKAGGFDVAAMSKAAEGLSYSGPRGTTVMHEGHVKRDIFLAEAQGISFKVVKTFANVGAGDNCT
jgi:ABC-type branched-subunit amino acid transport system substrate-binding protein